MMRGQEEAPIELLIGVTILTFVIIIAMYTFSTSCATQQEEKLRATFSKFAREMELVYFGAVGSSQVTTLDFTQVAGCTDYSIESIRILKGSSGTCMAQLGRDDCLVLVAAAEATDGTGTEIVHLIEVLDMSSDTNVKNKLNSASCSKDLSDIEWSEFDDPSLDGCWFKPSYYTIRITKTDSDTVSINDVA